MTEADNPFDVLKPYLLSDSAEEEIKNDFKKKELIALILKFKTLYEEQQTLIKVIENQLQGLLKTITRTDETPPEEKPKKESFMNEKILRKSLNVLEKDKKLDREILAVGEHYKVDIYRLLWKKHLIRHFYVLLSKKMKKTGYPDYKLNWDRINNLIKHQGKSIEDSADKEITPKNIKKIKSLISQTLG